MSTEDLCGLKALEAWAKRVTAGYRDVQVRDLSSSWKDGLAFCAIVHYFRPELIDFDSLSKENVLENNQLAFKICEKLGVLALLDAEDMAQCRVPDRNSIALYLSEVYECFEGSKNKPKAALYRRSFSGSSTGSNGSSAPPSLPSTPEPPMPPPRRSIANKRVNSVKF